MRIAVKLVLEFLRGTLIGVISFGVAVIADNSLFRGASGYLAMFFGLNVLRYVTDVALRLITRGKFHVRAATCGDGDGIIHELNFAVAAALGARVVYHEQIELNWLWDPEQANKGLRVLEGLAWIPGFCCLALSGLAVEYRWAHRFWMPRDLRHTIWIARYAFARREPIIQKAVDAFIEELPSFIQSGEFRGQQSIQLTFEKDGEILYGMRPEWLGWPRMRWGSKCEEKKFVYQARQAARMRSISAEVVLTDDKQRYCLELSW